jgi:predicted transcriptional regulator
VTARRVIHPAGAVTIDEFLRYLYAHRKQLPITKIAKRAKLPRSVVYRALKGENVMVRTLSRIANVLGAQVFVVVGVGENRLRA